MPILFFADTEELRQWFRDNHKTADEQWIGYYKVATGLPSVTWPESVDVALCFGWIDGIRKKIDERSYRVRFTPRRPGSSWSARNVGRMRSLIEAGLVEESARAAFESAESPRSAPATHELAAVALPEDYERRIKAVPEAWECFAGATPSYRKQCAHWIVSAKRELTRQKRLETLIECSLRGEPIPPLRWAVKMRPRR
ncbi:MAG: YdeI/OmpD-associated family protein [Bryobacterales bacterium]|nr:YdeI/OmpD-associated family protein [Bryobacterales bacterium]MDE0261059.1 YdeI/OmpD-associated family protein [Bryobacterales bacterium]MDE0624748.1 YdeI/OmpD-associated family protein [Bryobacterales bacterium]